MKHVRLNRRCLRQCGGAVIVVAVGLLPVPATAVLLLPGFDMFETTAGTEVEIGTEPAGDNPPLPAGFFGANLAGDPSDPFSGVIALQGLPIGPLGMPAQPEYRVTWFDTHGNEVGPDSRHAVSQVVEEVELPDTDTKVERKASIELTNLGDTAIVPIEIVALSLVSVDPIQVTFGPSPRISEFDVFVELSPSVPQIDGAMKLTVDNLLTDGVEGVMTIGDASDPLLGLPIAYQITFVNVNPDDDPGIVQVQVVDGLFSDFFNENGRFQLRSPVPEPTTLALCSLLGIAAIRRRRKKGR